MKFLSHRSSLLLGAGLGCLGVGIGIAACSSSSSGSGSGGSGNSGDCSGAPLNIIFNPMYSAYIGPGMQNFQIPALVAGVSAASVTWSASDPSIQMQADTSFGGEMLTVTALPPNGGVVTITAKSGTSCGTAPLNVTSNTLAQWQLGHDRYNNDAGINLPTITPGHFPSFNPGGPSLFEPQDGGPGPACTNCHGPTATNGMFRGVEHTPEQTGGFSDQQLTDIIVKGIIPDGGYYNSDVIPYQAWQFFHKWADLTPDQQVGMIVYLRSLVPAPAGGSFDFNGFGNGGMGITMTPPPTTEAGTEPEDSGTAEVDSSTSAEASTVGDATVTDGGTSGDATPE